MIPARNKKLFTLCLLAFSSLVSGPVSADTCPSKTANPGLKYFGYYNYYHTWATYASDPSASFDLAPLVGNTNFVPVYPGGLDSQYVDRLKAIQAAGLKAKVDFSFMFLDGNNAATLRDPTLYRANWEKFLADVAPYRDAIGFFYVEEAYWGASLAAVTKVNDLVTKGQLNFKNTADKIAYYHAAAIQPLASVNHNLATMGSYLNRDFPGIPYALVEAPATFYGNYEFPGDVPKCQQCVDAIQLPSNLNWVGIEGPYVTRMADFNRDSLGNSAQDYINLMEEKMQPDQKVVIVPPAALAPVDASNPSSSAYSDMSQVIDAYMNLAYTDQRVVAVMPYFWTATPPSNPGKPPNDPSFFFTVGLRDQSSATLRTKMQTAGRCIVNSSRNSIQLMNDLLLD